MTAEQVNPQQPSRTISRLIDAAEAIALDPETGEQDKAFLTRQLVQVTLPHSNPGKLDIWQRNNGDLSLSIRPGWDHEKNQAVGLPYGCIPRLLLFWITTEALRNKSRKLMLGDSLASFMRDLGLNPATGGGARGDSARLKKQMDSLFRATISLEVNRNDGATTGKRWLDMQIAPEGEFWWNFNEPEATSLFGSWIELGEKFYEAIVTSPVPMDKRALGALKQSPMALDFYAWSTYKTFSLSQGKKKEQFIPWRSFMAQMGADYSDVKNFKRKIKEAITKVQVVYPDLKIDDAHGGFIIKQSRPAVSQKPPKRVIS
ncbi:MAG: replication protein RepA [Cyanobacteria bacterium P01_D01_bin.156]